mmetsp:Transcript_28060/g.86811  ORF Transcript_28060/g.86811 Transcript_28060/m.86811 type:complete len:185 (-) Transcript_28060:44-598(-)
MHPEIVVMELLAVADVPGKKLKAATVRDADRQYKIVTNAKNVLEEKVGKKIVVARPGAEVPGLDEPVKKANVGGVLSEGMLVDAKMLWGGSAGTAIFLDDDYEVGAPPPASKPRPKEATSEVAPAGEGLFAKKLTKEEKKAKAKADREARKARKAGGGGAAEAEAADDADDAPPAKRAKRTGPR